MDIDFGDVSIAMRNFLRKQGKKRFNPGTAASMLFLNATDPTTIKLARKVMIDWGYGRSASPTALAQSFLVTAADRRSRRATVGKPPLKAQVIHFINKPMPGGLPKKTARALLDIEDAKIVPIIRDPAQGDRGLGRGVLLPRLRLGAPVQPGRPRDAGDAVRGRRAVRAAAGLSVLRLSADRRGRTRTRGAQITTDNRVLFHRVANTLNYLDIKTVIVSCGTCMDQLEKYEFDKIFPGCRLLDIHEYLLEKGVKLDGRAGRALHVSRPLPHADEDATSRSRSSTELMGTDGAAERALLRRIRHARGDAARHLDAGPLPQGGGAAQGRGVRVARRRVHAAT